MTAFTAPDKTGYTFKHWSEAKNGTAFDFSKAITKNTTLYAVYEKNSYTVTYYEDTAGTIELDTKTVEYGTMLNDIGEPPEIPTGYEFAGWALKGTTTIVTFPYEVTENLEFVPIFTEEEQVIITFYDMDGTTVLATKKYPKGLRFDKPEDPAEKPGYTFKHWSLTKGGEEAPYGFFLGKDFDLYAVYEKNSYEVIFYKDTAGTDPMLTVSIGFEDTVAEPADEPAAPIGSDFDGWALKGTTAKVTFPYAITEKTEFVPIFKSIAPSEEATVTFIADGTMVKTVTLPKGTAIGAANMPENPTKEHYTFEGWFTKENGEGTQVTAATVVTEDTTVYAFLKAELLTVSFYDVTRYDNGDDPLLKVINIPYNTSVNQLLASDPAITIPANTTTEGFKRNASVARIYGTMGIDTTHILSNGWWVINGRAWEKFDMDAPVTENVKVYDNVKEVKMIVGMSRLSTIPLTVYANYDENTRAIDTVKDALFISESTVKTALNSDVGEKILEQMVKRGVIDNTTDKNILNQHRYVRLVNVIGKNNIKKLIGNVIDSSINKEDAKQYIHDYITDYKNKSKDDQDKTVTALEKAFETILKGEKSDKFKTALKPSVTKILVSDVETLKSLASAYVDSKVETTAGQNQIISLLNKSLKQYKDTDKAALQTFIVNFVVSQVKAGNTEITKEIKDYIIEQIKAGSYKNLVDGYIKAYVKNDTVKSIVIAVADSDFAFISADISAEMTSDRDFAKTVFGQLYDTDANFRKTIKDLLTEQLKEALMQPGVTESMAEQMAKDTINAKTDAEIKVEMIKYIGDIDNDIASLVSEALAKLETDKPLRDSTIGSYLDGVLGGEGKEAFLSKLVDELYNNTTLLDNASVKPVIEKAAADMLANIDSYTDVVSDYVRSLVEKENFGILSGNFVKLAKASRDTIISDLIDELKGQGLLDSFISTFIDMQFDEGKIEEAVVRKIVEYIADDKNSDTLDSITNAMFDSLTGEDLIDIAAVLGQTEASAKVDAVNQLIDELCDEKGTDVTVTNDRLFMFEPIYKMLSTHGWDFFEAKIPERAKALLPLTDIKKLFDRHYDPYVNAMKTAMESAKADPTATFYIGNGVQIDINPISDVLTPMLNYVKDMKAYAEGKAPTVTKEAFIKYYPYYENNPFKDAYEEFMETEKWVSGTDNGYTAELSGYKLHSFAAYYDILKALAVVLDDTMSWYYDDANVPAADREDVFAIAEDKVLAVANMLDRFLVDYAVNGIPTNLKDFCLDIETDPTMIEIIKKFGVEKYLEKLEDNATAGKVYDTVYDKINARFGARIDAILDRLYKSKLNRYYDDAEYQKGKEILHGLFTDKVEDQYTVDTVFDTFLKGVDQKEEEFNGITIELLRHIFYSVERIEAMHEEL